MCRIMQPGTNFNSRPHGGRPVLLRIIRIRLCISTHALTEGDYTEAYCGYDPHTFQLTPSRRATVCTNTVLRVSHISTHALTEGDHFSLTVSQFFHISTHALTEGDVSVCRMRFRLTTFQLTPSRRATQISFFSLL